MTTLLRHCVLLGMSLIEKSFWLYSNHWVPKALRVLNTVSQNSTFFEFTKYNWRKFVSIWVELKSKISDVYFHFWPIATAFTVPTGSYKKGQIWTKEVSLLTFDWYVMPSWFLSLTEPFSSFQMMDTGGEGKREHEYMGKKKEGPGVRVEVK